MVSVGAILLAAGASRRFGREGKLVADIGGVPLLRRVACQVSKCNFDDIVVVTGCEEQLCRAALQGLGVRFVRNDGWERGMGTSIATGVTALTCDLAGAFVIPGDMPFLRAGLLNGMAMEFARSQPPPIVFAATPSGEQRNPVLWPRRFFAKLGALSGEEGAKSLLRQFASQSVSVIAEDAAELQDIDTSTELAAARATLFQSKS